MSTVEDEVTAEVLVNILRAVGYGALPLVVFLVAVVLR